ncbi:hypothetical protein HWV62_21012 [Athelia sp. TMB]|nr:hypothetical protein HWV62_21012 [Athelia sp. TMB]
MHKTILINNVGLSSAINRYVPVLEELSFQDIVDKGWKHEPPKAISDVVESIIGAVLVDSGYNYDLTVAVTEIMLEDLLRVLTPSLRKDPISDLMIWTSCSGCRRIAFQKSQTITDGRKIDSVAILVHNKLVAGPISAPNLSLAKGLASERARAVLEDPKSDLSLKKLCDCAKNMEVDPSPAATMADVGTEEKGKAELQLTDETEEGFAKLADQARKDFRDLAVASPSRTPMEDYTDELAVEQMLLLSSDD